MDNCLNYLAHNPEQYHPSLKLEEATCLLNNTGKSIRDISADIGICTVFYFSKIFKDKLGKSPAGFRSLKKTSYIFISYLCDLKTDG